MKGRIWVRDGWLMPRGSRETVEAGGRTAVVRLDPDTGAYELVCWRAAGEGAVADVPAK